MNASTTYFTLRSCHSPQNKRTHAHACKDRQKQTHTHTDCVAKPFVQVRVLIDCLAVAEQPVEFFRRDVGAVILSAGSVAVKRVETAVHREPQPLRESEVPLFRKPRPRKRR